MACPIVHFEIAGRDGAGTAEFYRQLFGWEIAHDTNMNYWLVQPGGEPGSGIGGGILSTPGPVPPYITVYALVDDLQAYLDRAVELGAEALVPPTPIPGHGSFAMFRDPDGNCFGLYRG